MRLDKSCCWKVDLSAPTARPPYATRGAIPGWGDAICWNELHHTTPYHNTWD